MDPNKRDARHEVLDQLLLKQRYFKLPLSMNAYKPDDVIPVSDRIFMITITNPKSHLNYGVFAAKTYPPKGGPRKVRERERERARERKAVVVVVVCCCCCCCLSATVCMSVVF